MSHQPERIEKNCLNCGTEVAGRYCQKCGQENIVTHQTAWHLFQHFLADLFHFDGKFFETLRLIITKPGFVPKEYVAGRRVNYLDPIRMYLFTSAVFFLIFSSINHFEVGAGEITNGTLSHMDRYQVASELSRHPADAADRRFIPLLLDTAFAVDLDIDSAHTSDSIITFQAKKYVLEADSMAVLRQHDFELDLGHNWFGRLIRKRLDHMNRRFIDDNQGAKQAFIESLLHRLPYMLFVSLPFFALCLKLLYWRRKQFFYADHMVFTLYHYIFNFMLLLVIMLIARLNVHGWQVLTWLNVLLFAAGMLSLYKGMRRFYGQKRGKTLLKFFLLNTLGIFMLLLLTLMFVLISALQF